MKRQPPGVLALGDLGDVEAHVRAVVRTLALGKGDDFGEYVEDGIELVLRREKTLAPGQSLKYALDGWLYWRLRDRWRERHPEWRRNVRAGTSYSLPVPTGLASEHPGEGGAETFELAARDEQPLIDSRLHLERFQSEAELRDPRAVGRYVGVPSWGALPTGAARELWSRIEEERGWTAPPAASPPPRFLSKTDL